MPLATEIPPAELAHLAAPPPGDPLGPEGAGDAGVIPASAAIASAIEDAEGFPVTRMPMSPSDLFSLRLNAGMTSHAHAG
jgi:CO/xanthine dehydrogenase Mo-binding subunit